MKDVLDIIDIFLRYKPGTVNVMADQSLGPRRDGLVMENRDRRQQQYRGHGAISPDPNAHPPVPHDGVPGHVVPTPEPESFTIKVPVTSLIGFYVTIQ